MSNKDEARISGFIRCQIEVERPLTRAELNVRRVVGLTVIAAIIGALCGWFFPLDTQQQPASKVEKMR